MEPPPKLPKNLLFAREFCMSKNTTSTALMTARVQGRQLFPGRQTLAQLDGMSYFLFTPRVGGKIASGGLTDDRMRLCSLLILYRDLPRSPQTIPFGNFKRTKLIIILSPSNCHYPHLLNIRQLNKIDLTHDLNTRNNVQNFSACCESEPAVTMICYIIYL